MLWLLELETENDPISLCRLMNNFRRKHVSLVSLSLAAAGSSFSVMAIVETPEAEVDHLFNFLRRSEGVEHVSCYFQSADQDSASDSSYVFLNAGADSLGAARAAESFPGSKVVFASQGKYLLELGPENRVHSFAVANDNVDSLAPLYLARVKTTRTQAISELVA